MLAALAQGHYAGKIGVRIGQFLTRDKPRSLYQNIIDLIKQSVIK